MGAGILATIGAKLLGDGAEGIGKGTAAILDSADEYFHTKEEKAAMKLVKEKILLEPQKWQAKINLIEAGHRSLFVAGWRPAIGWICAMALFWGWIVAPFVKMYCDMQGIPVALPAIELGQAISLIMAMLGMGALRTYEKRTGLSK